MSDPKLVDPGDQPDAKAETSTDKTGGSDLRPVPSASDESPDRDTLAWEGPEPEESVGLVDPRREIPNPPGL